MLFVVVVLRIVSTATQMARTTAAACCSNSVTIVVVSSFLLLLVVVVGAVGAGMDTLEKDDGSMKIKWRERMTNEGVDNEKRETHKSRIARQTCGKICGQKDRQNFCVAHEKGVKLGKKLPWQSND